MVLEMINAYEEFKLIVRLMSGREGRARGTDWVAVTTVKAPMTRHTCTAWHPHITASLKSTHESPQGLGA